MGQITHVALVARLGKVAEAHAELHKHVHRLAGVPAPSVPAVSLPAAGTAPKKGG